MTISAKLQSLSNMLRQLFAFLILGGLIALRYCEPVNRKRLLRVAETAIGCASNDGDAAMCAIANKTTDVSSRDREERARVDEDVVQRAMGDSYFNLDDEPAEVTGRKKKKGFYRMILYMIGAMKAMLIHGLLHGVAALAAKAVLISKIALAVAIAAILKKHDHESTSYEIVKHPQHSYVQTHSSSVDYDHGKEHDHRSDYMEDRNEYMEASYDHRKRRLGLR